MNTKITSFQNVPQLPFADYYIDIFWPNISRDWIEGVGLFGVTLNFDTDYQRDYVWTDYQKSSYIEYLLRGGVSGKDIYLNCKSWSKYEAGDTLDVVDGKQRIQAIVGFMQDRVKAFGLLFSQFEGKLRPTNHRLTFHINQLQTELECVDWYIALNRGGTMHTEADMQKAYDYRDKLKSYE